MAFDAITFDLWGTVLWPRDSEDKLSRRMAALLRIVEDAGHSLTTDVILDAWKASFHEAELAARQTMIEIGPRGRWGLLSRRLGLADDAVPFETVDAMYEQLTLESPPPLMEGVADVLLQVRERGYKLGLICNTGITGGAVIRRVLDGHGVLDCFHATVFSNEFGKLKPDPSIFFHTWEQLGGVAPQRALHIGDLEELDVDGALASGSHALRYVHQELYETPVQSRARVFHRWDDFFEVLDEIEARTA
jgi:putative hydrolase of the HAD superfamily